MLRKKELFLFALLMIMCPFTLTHRPLRMLNAMLWKDKEHNSVQHNTTLATDHRRWKHRLSWTWVGVTLFDVCVLLGCCMLLYKAFQTSLGWHRWQLGMTRFIHSNTSAFADLRKGSRVQNWWEVKSSVCKIEHLKLCGAVNWKWWIKGSNEETNASVFYRHFEVYCGT